MEQDIIGDYEILRELGEGPLGTVYMGMHRFIKRRFILKLLPETVVKTSDFLKRFEEKVGLLAALTHQHIAKVHNVSESNGRYFIVTDLVVDESGHSLSLDRFLEKHPQAIPEKALIKILSQVASAIDFAHQNGVVHRNLKCSNVLLRDSDLNAVDVSVTDFGLADVVGEGHLLTQSILAAARSLPDHTPDTVSMNKTFDKSFSFLSPEQKRGSNVTLASDAYAFGILTYYLIMRCYPEGFFPLPSSLANDYQSKWDDLIYACLQKDPAKRPKSLSSALQDVVHMDNQSEDLSKWQAAGQVPLRAIKNLDITRPKVVERAPVQSVQREPLPVISDPVDIFSDSLAPKAKPASQMRMATPMRESVLKPVIKPQEIEKPVYEADPGAIFQTESIVAPYKPAQKELVDIEPILTDMVIIPGAEYCRGSNQGKRDERPYHKVRLNSYALDVHPVTNEQFVRFLMMMGGEKDSANNDIIRLRDSRISKFGGNMVVESGYDMHPVIGVTWYGSVAYAKWVGKRLPTEAEWEVAARSLTPDKVYPTGEEIDRSLANYFSADTTRVMSFPSNDVGLYDMAGNVYEWCSDWYDYNYYEASRHEPNNPLGPYQGVYRVLRGGCWKSLKDDLRCSHRQRNNPGTVNRTYGFRCASDCQE